MKNWKTIKLIFEEKMKHSEEEKDKENLFFFEVIIYWSENRK